MADINNKLRLQIVTQLDAAGIKATKEQVDALELGLRRAGNGAVESGAKFGALEKSIGKLPGKLGEIASKFGGLAGQITMLAGAFTTGVEIGNKIVDVQRKLGLLADPMAELKKKNAEYAASLESVKNAIDVVADAEKRRVDAADSASTAAIKAVDDQTAAYLRQADVVKNLRAAQGNAEMIRLERAKFDEQNAYRSAGYDEAAEQIGRYYDVLIEEERVKQRIAEFDRESARAATENAAAEKALAAAAERAQNAKNEQANAESKLVSFRKEKSLGGFYFDAADEQRDNALENDAKIKKAAAERAMRVYESRAAAVEKNMASSEIRQMQRANIAAEGALAVDRAAAAYDDYTNATGNPGGFSVDKSWAADMLKNSVAVEKTQQDVLSVVKSLGDRLERLLVMKGE